MRNGNIFVDEYGKFWKLKIKGDEFNIYKEVKKTWFGWKELKSELKSYGATKLYIY